MTDTPRPEGEPPDPGDPLAGALPGAAREVEQFVAAAGWDQSPQLFALVPTRTLLADQPQLAEHVDAASPLTPVAQEALPEGELDDALARIQWPDAVAGCALAQEIIVLPPDVEQRLGGLPDDAQQARRVTADHPERREARLVAAVLRAGVGACVIRLRTGDGSGELLEHPDLAPNLLRALLATLE